MRTALCTAFLAAVLMLSAGAALSTGDDILSEEEKGRFSETLLLPSPSEVFVALDKLGKADWVGAASYSPKYDYENDYLRALNLGVRSADGFLAIQAKDKSRLGEMIVVIITLAEELLVRETILDKGKTFEELSKQGKWHELHRELDALREDVMEEIKRLGDQDVALLVSAGGWLEGLRATTKILTERYDPTASSVLYQPRLVDYFDMKLGELQRDDREHPAVQELRAKLPEIKTLVDVGFKNPVPEDNIKKLHDISTELVTLIERG